MALKSSSSITGVPDLLGAENLGAGLEVGTGTGLVVSNDGDSVGVGAAGTLVGDSRLIDTMVGVGVSIPELQPRINAITPRIASHGLLRDPMITMHIPERGSEGDLMPWCWGRILFFVQR